MQPARGFYGNVLGLRFISDDSFAIVMDANGTMVRIVRVDDFTPFPFTILGWQVNDNCKEWHFFDTTKVAVNGPRLPRIPPRFHHKNTTAKHPNFQKPPAKTAFHHPEKITRKSRNLNSSS
jgi:hypothetical protein